jgi:hypothetical protein
MDDVKLTINIGGYFYTGPVSKWRDYARTLSAGKRTFYRRSLYYGNQSLTGFFDYFRRTWNTDRPVPEPDSFGHTNLQPANWHQDVAAFVGFVETVLGLKPDGYSLDRIDNEGNYAPGNLKWSTTFQQANNKRTNRFVTYGSNLYTVAEFSRMIVKDPRGVLRSLNRGKSPEQIAVNSGFQSTVLPLAA